VGKAKWGDFWRGWIARSRVVSAAQQKRHPGCTVAARNERPERPSISHELVPFARPQVIGRPSTPPRCQSAGRDRRLRRRAPGARAARRRTGRADDLRHLPRGEPRVGFARRHCSWCGDNPFAEHETSERPKVSATPQRRIYVGAELAQVLAAATEPWRALFRLASVVGRRESGLLGRCWRARRRCLPRVIYEQADDGGWGAHSPDVGGVFAHGETPEGHRGADGGGPRGAPRIPARVRPGRFRSRTRRPDASRRRGRDGRCPELSDLITAAGRLSGAREQTLC
jgi:hypothetical protein